MNDSNPVSCPVCDQRGDMEDVAAWVRGIDAGIWHPTDATKRHLAQILRFYVLKERAS